MKNTQSWDEEKGLATYTIITKNGQFTGYAKCHKEDVDMKNSLTGLEIAYRKAFIKYYRYVRTSEIKEPLKVIAQLISTLEQSSNFNRKHYESKMIYRKQRELQEQLEIINDILTTSQQSLSEYLHQKEKCYSSIRKFRAENVKNPIIKN